MLSPGKFHLDVPRDRRRNNFHRRNLVARCLASRRARDLDRAACEADCLYWINSWAMQVNPASFGSFSPRVGPFVTWGFQDAAVRTLLDCIDGGRDAVIEKSREMGASWLCLLVFDWLLLFRPWESVHCISRDEKAVDKRGDDKSLFAKIDFVHEYLPEWVVGDVERVKHLFRHRKTRSTITGEASTGKAGVGGRARVMFMDEFSQIDEGFDVLGRTSDTARCRIFNSTHTGTHTAFYDLLYGTAAQISRYEHIVLHWTQHPDKRKGLYRYDPKTRTVEVLDHAHDYGPDFAFVREAMPTGGPFPGVRSPWYDLQCSRKGSARQVAIDLDIDPKGATTQFFNAVHITELRNLATDPVWEGDVHFEGEAARLVEFRGGPLKLWVRPDYKGLPPNMLYGVGCDISTGTGATPSVASIVSEYGRKVGEYVTRHQEPRDFARTVVGLCRLFAGPVGEGARLIWEAQGPGLPFGKRVIALDYRNVYCRTTDDGVVPDPTDKPGWYSSKRSKILLFEDYRAALQTGRYINPSDAALAECLDYAYGPDGSIFSGLSKNPDPSGSGDNHGDRPVADALGLWAIKDSLATADAPKAVDRILPGSLAHRRKAYEDRKRELESWGGDS